MKIKICLISIVIYFVSSSLVHSQDPLLPSWIVKTIYIDTDYSRDGNGSISEPYSDIDFTFESKTAYLFKRGTSIFKADQIRLDTDSAYVGSYGKGDVPKFLIDTGERNFFFVGIDNTVSNIEIVAQDTAASAVLAFLGSKTDYLGQAWIESVTVSHGFIGITGYGFERINIKGCHVFDLSHDGIFLENCDTAFFDNVHVHDINTDWSWTNDITLAGGDCIQSENVNSIFVLDCYLDHSAWGGKFSLITNGNDTTIVLNSTLISTEGTSAAYISKAYFDGCRIVDGEYGIYDHMSGCRYYNCIFEDNRQSAIYGSAHQVYNCTFVNIPDIACNGFQRNWDVRNSIFYNVKQIFHADSKNITATHNLYYNEVGPEPEQQFGEGNFIFDPLFLDFYNGDYRLSSGSQAIDTGLVLNEVTHDFNGVLRPVGEGYDLGAYEYYEGSIPSPNISLYPVPADGYLEISFLDDTFNGELFLYLTTTLGQVLYKDYHSVKQNTIINLNISQFPEGACFVFFKTANNPVHRETVLIDH